MISKITVTLTIIIVGYFVILDLKDHVHQGQPIIEEITYYE